MTLLAQYPDEKALPWDLLAASAPMPRIRYSSSRVDYATWRRFVDTGSAEGLDPVLAESWRRCVHLGVSPEKKHPIIRTMPMSPVGQNILEMSHQLDGLLSPVLGDNGLMVSITDAEGRLVRSFGDAATMRRADRLRFCPGAEWTEGSVGTNAIGTALQTGYVVQIFDREHFCFDHQIWRCTAAPFFSPMGQMVGCFDISSGSEVDHAQALRLVLWCIRVFERSLLQSHTHELEAWPEVMLAALPPMVNDEGVIVVQSQGKICGLNDKARWLMGGDARLLVGQRVSDVFDVAPLAGIRQAPPGTGPVTLQAIGRPDLKVDAMPLHSPAGLWLGMLLRFNRTRRAQTALPDRTARVFPGKVAAASCPPPPFIGHSEAARFIRQQISAFAQTPSTVVVTGESGTGKELVAKGIHCSSERWGGPFVAVNCGAFAKDLIQSELFGYEGGSFTGADRKGRPGVFERADQGTLFLDEICELPLEQQANLLRVLEDRRVTRVGGRASVAVNVKIIAATNRDMADEVTAGRFRADLYHRLWVATIVIPPLRDRLEDVRPLVDYHFARLCAEMGLSGLSVDPGVYDLLRAQRWPGNVRALVNALEYALNQYFVAPYSVLACRHLPPDLQEKPQERSRGHRLREAESQAIVQALIDHGGNISSTARALGIGRNTLYAKLRRLRGSDAGNRILGV